MALNIYIHRLERLSDRCGVPVVRNSLHAQVMGRVEARRIVLRTGLSPEQQFLTLAHELTHLLVHYHVLPHIDRTVCEYEAEAVERWIGTELRVPPYAHDALDIDSVTDGLLACSVKRVRSAALVLLQAAVGPGAANYKVTRLQPQATVQVNAASGKEVIFNDKLRGMRDFLGLTQAL